MAIHAPITGTPMRAPLVPVPPAAISRVLSRFDRDQLAGFVAVAIDLLDVADGDLDVEANGDELDGTGAEDDFGGHKWDGPGCPISDPDEGIDDKGHDDINDDREQEYDAMPSYGIDQTKGPINEAAAYATMMRDEAKNLGIA